MFGYIYKTTNKINNKIYIGQHRSQEHDPSYIGSGKLIKRAIQKYGFDNFSNEIISICHSQKELDVMEINMIQKFNSTNKEIGYNITHGGQGGNITSSLPKEDYEKMIARMSVNNSGKNNPNYGNGNKIRGDKNPAKRPDVRKKISEAVSGEKNGNYGRRYSLPNKKRHGVTCTECGDVFQTHADNKLRCYVCEFIYQLQLSCSPRPRIKTNHDGKCVICKSEFAKKTKKSSICNRCKTKSRKIPR